MNYTWITHEPSLSGANRCMVEIIEVLLKQNHNVHVITTRNRELTNYLSEISVSYSIIHYYGWGGKLNFQGFKRGLRNFFSIPNFIKVFKQINSDIIITNTVTIGIGAISAKINKREHYWFIHEFGKEDHGIKLKFGEKFTHKIINKLSKKVIVVSKALKEKYKKNIKEKKIKVLYNYPQVPANLKKQQKKSNNIFKLIIVGQIVPGKRQKDAILAVKNLIKKNKNIHLDILGHIVNQEYYIYIKEIIKKNQLENFITFKDFTPNPFQLIINSDLVLVCSRAEAFGRVTVEAMKLGMPVIGANAGGTTELIKDGINGYLYKVKDYFNLSEKIEYCINNKNKLKELSNNAFSWSNENFSEAQFSKKIEEIFMLKK